MIAETPTDRASELLSGAEALAGSDPDAALRTLDRLDRLTDTPRETLAGSRYLRARLLAMSGDPTAALKVIAEARALWHEAGDDLSAVRAGLGEMHVLDDLGRHNRAIEVGEAMLVALAEIESRSSADTDTCRWVRAATLHNVGTARGFTGDHVGALANYTDAERTWQQLGLEREQATEQTNRGVELTAVGRAGEALAELERAAETFAQLDDELTSATVRGHRADALVSLGRYTEALAEYEQARIELEHLGAHTESARLTVRTATTYLRLDLSEEAALLARQAITSCRDAGLDHDRARADLLAGEIALRSEDFDAAAVHFDAAISGFAQVRDGPGQVDALLARSRLAARTGQPERAQRDGTSACALADAADWPPAAIAARLTLIDLAPGTRRADELLVEARERATALPIPDLHYSIDWRTARQHRIAGRFDAAGAVLDSTMATLEQVRGRLTDDELRRSFSAGRAQAQEERLRLALMGPADAQVDAVLAADAAKTRTLAEWMDDRQAILDGRATPDLDRSDVELRTTYTELLRSGNRPVSHRKHLLRRIDELERQSKIARLRRRSRSDGHVARPIATTPAQDDVDRAGSAPIVVYQQIDDEILALVRTSTGDVVHRNLAHVGAATDLVQELEGQWRRQRINPELQERHADRLLASTNSVLRSIDEMLLASIRDSLVGSESDELVIVPDGILHRIPFAALFDGVGSLADRWTVTTAPSVEVASRLARGQSWSAPSTALVLGVSDDQIPNVDVEVGMVAEAYPHADCLFGADASLASLRERAASADVVHLACHGMFRAGNPMYSSIRLGDGWVTAHDLVELDVGGALVVSSSCESGRVDQRGYGDESTGLTWALLAAGASGVVVSLWRIDDAATSELMRDFHELLAAGARPARALRGAQLAARARRAHPYHWAPFAYVGGLPSPSPRHRPEGKNP